MMRASPSSLDGWSGHRTTTRTTKAAASPTRRSRSFTERQHHRRGVVRSGTFSSSQSGTHKDEKDRYGKKTLTIVPVERRRATSAKASAGGTSEEMEKTTDETTTEANAKRKSTGATPLLVVNLEKGTVKMAKNRKKDKAKLQGVLATAVKRSEVKLTDMGAAKIGPLDEDDCMDATNLVMDLLSIGIASTKSLTSISGKRTVGSSAFVDITRVYLLIQTPSPSLFSLFFFFFPKELFPRPLQKGRPEMSENSSLLSLSLSFSRAFLWMDKKMTRVSCYTNAPRSPLPRRAACFTSHRAARERFLLRRKRGG